MSGRQVTKADLLELARALGDEEVSADESSSCIFLRALDRARALAAPAELIGPQPAAVVAWSRIVLADADQHLARSVTGDEAFKSDVYRHWVTMHVERAAEGRPRGLPPLAMVEDRSPEQLEADDDQPDPFDAEVQRAARMVCSPPGGDRIGATLDWIDAQADRRKNAEEWAKTRGSKRGRSNA